MCNIPLHNVHAGSKQPLKCLHIHDCNGTEVKTRLFVKKGTKYQYGFWTQNTDTHLGVRLQKKPQKQESCFWFLSVLLFGETRLMKYKPDLKDKYRSQIHPTVVLKDDLKAMCDRYKPHTQKIENLPWGSSSASPASTWSSTPDHAPGFWNLTASYQKVAGFWMAACSSMVHETSKEQKRMTRNTDHLLT